MFGFRTVPVDVAVASVLTWANLDWPVTLAEALAVRDRLGWTGDPNDYRGFATSFGTGAGHDGGRVVFTGTPSALVSDASTLTGAHLARNVGA